MSENVEQTELTEEIEEIEELDEVEEVDEAETMQQELLLKIEDLQNQLLKERAEVENFKRRTKQEYDTNLKFASQSMIEKMLPILDGFDRAIGSVDRTDEKTRQFLKGFEMIQTLYMQLLESEGLAVIGTVGEPFDPYLHQGIMQESNEDIEDDVILEELQKGYTLKDRVIRASMVKVNKK
ncbi:protein GrpE [Erysipelotrichaceae bacterium]|nr:protein GrpE [Erysipelotrichaceae bacterium]